VLKNIIFDWSGTIVDDLPVVLAGTNSVLKKLNKPELTREQFREQFCLPFIKFYQRIAGNDCDMHELGQWFLDAVAPIQHNVTQIPYAEDFLKFVKNANIQTFLFSSIHRKHYEEIKEKIGFTQYLDHPFVNIWDKKAKILDLVRDFDITPNETLFIGDMVHDVETAQYAKIHNCAVLTGYTTIKPLQEVHPELIVNNLAELQQLLQKYQFDWQKVLDANKV